MTGLEAVEYERASWSVVSSGCPGYLFYSNSNKETDCMRYRIDQLLEFNGFATGTITEFAGLSSTGKTQLAFFSILTSLCLLPMSTALYIDSNCSFSPSRMKQLYEQSDRFQSFRDQGLTFEHISQRLCVSPCYNAFELMNCLNGLQHRVYSQSHKFEQNLKLIVIDSVGALLAPIVGSGSTTQSILVTISLLLRVLSKSYAIPVITLNHAVQAREHERAVPNVITMKPALGSTWAQTPTQTLFFTDPSLSIGVNQKESNVWEFENRKGETIIVIRRRVEVLKAARDGNVALGTWRYLQHLKNLTLNQLYERLDAIEDDERREIDEVIAKFQREKETLLSGSGGSSGIGGRVEGLSRGESRRGSNS
ncbi:UNVERIFIED_CONTAM: hypothetical protein HDU68_010237 [Siphonaria sp. JEL0065]|nr:hypothetical protein HDU68_010237 [Siphonaria sp. JEL0065]